MGEVELLPCPLCGAMPEGPTEIARNVWLVKCGKYMRHDAHAMSWESASDVVAIWNTRASRPAIDLSQLQRWRQSPEHPNSLIFDSKGDLVYFGDVAALFGEQMPIMIPVTQMEGVVHWPNKLEGDTK